MYTKLRHVRLALNVPIESILATLNLRTKSAYYKKELGHNKFSLEDAFKLSQLFRLTIEELFFDE